METEKLKEARQKHAQEMAQKEKEDMKALHYMHCPKCGMPLEEIDFRSVYVDKCFHCGGLWLDEGELEKLTGEDDDSILGRISRILK